MDRSSFTQASSSRHGHGTRSRYDLPRWRSPSPMVASMIPPPIVQNVQASPPQTSTHSVVIEPPTPLQDRQGELEADLQFLLDAQAEGLVKGLEGGLPDDQTSNGSTTPTAQSLHAASARHSKRPSHRKPGLRSARKGIYTAMLALSSLKDDELAEIDDHVREGEKTLGKIDDFEKKRHGLEEATKTVDADEETVRAQRLRHEAEILSREISSVELQLADMKARHRKLMRQVSTVENSVQAKLASYSSSLRMLEDDVQKFLSSPSETQASTPAQDGTKSVYQLPPKRRTLELVKQHWNAERRAILEQRQTAEHEKSVLDEGAAVWKGVVSQVTTFERTLRAKVSNMSNSTASSEPVEQSQEVVELVERVQEIAENLASSFETAKERNWNLLIAAIGAELDALKQGKMLLENLLSPSEGRLVDETSDVPAQQDSRPSQGVDEILELDKSFEASQRRMSNGTDSSDPDPELMFSKQDTDTEE